MKWKLITVLAFLLVVIGTGATLDKDDENLIIGYDLLDDGETLHFWNTQDSYCLNTSSGIQYGNCVVNNGSIESLNDFTKNIFCLGYKTESWNYLCVDDLPVVLSYESDNVSYVEIHGKRNISIGGRIVEFELNDYLGLHDSDLNVTISIKHISGSDINVPIGFAWRVTNINIDGDSENDKLFVNNSVYDLNDSLDLLFSDMIETKEFINYTWNGNCSVGCRGYSNLTCNDCWNATVYHQNFSIPFYKIMDKSYVRLRWNPNLNYFLQVKNVSSQINAPVTLVIITNGLSINQTKSTSFYWKDPAPSVELLFPADSTTSVPSSTTITANITTGSTEYIRNMSLYHDVSGSFILNQTVYTHYPINQGYDAANNLNSSGMLMYLRFDNNPDFGESNILAYDYAGGKHNATIVDFPYTFTGQRIGRGAIAPNDAFNDYVQVDASRELDSMPEITVAMWVNVNTCENNDEFLKYNNAYIIRIKSDCTVDLIFWNDGFRGMVSSEALNTNQWYHLAFTYNSADGGKLYINGHLDFTNLAGTGDIGTANQDMGIGASPGGGSEILSGEIDEVMIFNRTLDSAEINRTRDVSENYTANFSLSGLPDGTVEWNVKATDNESATAFASSNFTFTVGAGGDTTPPVASFGTNPVDGFNTTATSINFSLKCVDETGIDTLKLYGNWTGTWGINQTNSSPVNDVFWNITVDNIPVGTHRWGAFCNDTSDNSDFTDTNRTFTIAVKSVNTSLVTPSGNADFVKNDFEIFTVQACCNSVVNCGMVNASLDPEIQLIDPNTENLEDGWMDSLAPTTEYGVDTVLLLLNDSGASPQERHFMIKFNLSDITADSTINDGELVFNLIFNGLDAGEYLNSTVQLVYSFPTFNVSDSDWVEGGGTSGGQSCQNADLCWSTRPTTSTEINFTILDFFYFTDSSSLTDYTYNVTEAIQFQIDNGKSDVSFYMGFVDAQANFVGDILRFASKEYTDDVSLRPYLNVTFTVAEESTKSGLVSTVPGTLPFWTNTSNPLNATLDAGECKDFTWYVNATGTVGTNHSFFAFVNITSDESINAVTNSINITIISGITDTCIYGGSGNYNVFYADNCTWTDQNFGDGTSNMILGGVGSGYAWCNNTILNFSKIIRNISAVYHYEFRESTCTLGG